MGSAAARAAGRSLLTLALGFSLGCSTQAAPPVSSLETIDTLARLGDRSVTPAGEPLPFMGGPFPSFGSGVQSAAGPGLSVFPLFSEGQVAACFTTEVWEEFERVWLQPLYMGVVPAGQAAPLPVFGVAPDSRFYAPYWQVFNYTPKPGVQFKSERDVLDSGVRLTPGVGKYCSLTADPLIGTAVQQGGTVPIRPLSGDRVGQARNAIGYVNGRITRFVDLGDDQRVTWNYETLVVDETPLYVFFRQDAKQNPLPVDLPRVAGTGPLHTPRCDGHGNCSGVANSVPTFGGLWRQNEVLLPPEADVYVRPSEPALRSAMQGQGFAAAVPDQDLGDAFTLRVAVNGSTCLGPGMHVADCLWLDSQNAIEARLPDWRVTQTETRLACPLILFNGRVLQAP